MSAAKLVRMVHSLRRAKATDDPALSALAGETFEPLGDDALTIVAENEAGEISGFCSMLFPSRDIDADSTVCELAAIYVHPDRQRLGIGRNLIRAALDKAAGDGHEVVTTWVPNGDDGATTFFQGFGFKPDGALLEQPGQEQHKRLRLALL